MIKSMFRHVAASPFIWSIVIAVAGTANSLFGDFIPPGHKPVSHRLVFVDSQLLQSHRLIATPVRGFGGVEEVEANRPFRFSTKYGTRLYAVPGDYASPERVGPGEILSFPSCEVPVSCVTFVPTFSPVASLLTTCKLTEITEDQIRVEVLQHEKLDAKGRPASILRRAVPLGAIACVGLIGCLAIWRRTASRDLASDHP